MVITTVFYPGGCAMHTDDRGLPPGVAPAPCMYILQLENISQNIGDSHRCLNGAYYPQTDGAYASPGTP